MQLRLTAGRQANKMLLHLAIFELYTGQNIGDLASCIEIQRKISISVDFS